MAFLDNSGDIILDAVLTDAGRARLAKGDGSFRITKFALGDDEINYALYDKENANGTAYFDLDIMQTPIFEAFTNNIASLNSKLISFSMTNLLHLPVLKVNYLEVPYADSDIVQSGYILAVDADTEKMLSTSGIKYNADTMEQTGILNGSTIANGAYIRVDQGIDSLEISAASSLDPDLRETQYIVEIDNRFASLISSDGKTALKLSFVDDDDMASYYISEGDGTNSVIASTNAGNAQVSGEVIDGPKGTTVKFKLKSALEVSTSDYLFNQLGTDVTSLFTKSDDTAYGTNIRSIVTSVRITGYTTGYSIDIPLVLIKAIS
jgi:hypothetical protein